jgi:ketosteroid isomerase-like protein
MGSAELDVVRGIWDEFSRLSFPAEAFDERAEWHTARDEPDATTYRGRDEIGSMLADTWGLFRDRYSRPGEFIDAGDWVVVPWQGGGRWRGSDLPAEFEETHAYRLSGGKVVEVREYRTRDEALSAHPRRG